MINASVPILLVLLAQEGPGQGVWRQAFDSTPIAVTKTVAAARDLGIASVIDGAVGRDDGRLCLADYREFQVVCVDSEGRLLFRVGRRGNGPGEFSGLYRIALSRDGSLHAFDRRKNTIAIFDKAGQFVREHLLPFRLSQPDAIVVVGNALIMSGVAAPLGGDPSSAIHRFLLGDPVSYESHFASLPKAKSIDLLRLWGAGSIRLADDNTLVYTPKGAYEIFLYSPNGAVLSRVVPRVQPTQGADDAIEIKPTGQVGITGRDFTVAASGTILNKDYVIATRATRGNPRTQWDFIRRATGQTVTAEVGASLLAVDQTRSVLWALGEDGDGLPTVTRLSYQWKP